MGWHEGRGAGEEVVVAALDCGGGGSTAVAALGRRWQLEQQ